MVDHNSHNLKRNVLSIASHIKRTRKERTILFSDIKHSTHFWALHGDIEGRLMVDRHNRLLFPIIIHFRGRIVKTIGDAILAAFKKADDAVNAAIAIQQVLKKERDENPSFTLKVRIGMHSGETIVEHNDVFGDVVNIASRIESKSRGNQILLSTETLSRLEKQNFTIQEKLKFIPRGKTDSITAHECLWEKSPELHSEINLHTKLSVFTKQKYEIILSLLGGLTGIFLLISFYLRFALSESESIALILLNPVLSLFSYPLFFPILLSTLGLIGYFIYQLLMIKILPLTTLRIIKGGFGFFIFFSISLIIMSNLPDNYTRHLNTAVYSSEHLFVESLTNNNRVYAQPSMQSAAIKSLTAGQLLLLADIRKNDALIWNKVLIAKETYGWIPRVLPPQIGIPAKRLTITDKFHFYFRDIYSLILGFFGFIWGFFTFKIQPT